MRILLLAGGWSGEREVSLRGAAFIEQALKSRGHSVTLLDPAIQFDRLLETARDHDVTFINLHGAPGEDGLIQALLERGGCAYQGAGPAGSFLALHKAAAKQVFRAAGLLTADWVYLPTRPDPGWVLPLPYPVFVKANNGGSSLNVFPVADAMELEAALNCLFDAGKEVLIESSLQGLEVTCGVLGDEALPPILIRSPSEFFDFKSKYAAVDAGGAQEICPAPLPKSIIQQIRANAVKAHRALGLDGYSRADFILTADQCLYILEVNTIPGMTATSLVPKEAAVIGLSFADVVERLLSMALQRHAGAAACPTC